MSRACHAILSSLLISEHRCDEHACSGLHQQRAHDIQRHLPRAQLEGEPACPTCAQLLLISHQPGLLWSEPEGGPARHSAYYHSDTSEGAKLPQLHLCCKPLGCHSHALAHTQASLFACHSRGTLFWNVMCLICVSWANLLGASETLRQRCELTELIIYSHHQHTTSAQY